jgi:hydrogenase/urease accessory protein HupE
LAWAAWCLLIAAWLSPLTSVAAHEVRPALLQIVESAPGTYQATWKQPVVGDMAIRLIPRLSSGALDRPPESQTVAPGFIIRVWRVTGGTPLDGQTASVEGLPQSVTDVIVRVSGAGGHTVEALLRPAQPAVTLDLSGPKGIAVPGYLVLGVEHILTGADHLMFVLGLLLLIGPNWRIVKAVSAFTVAHSITLALAALGYIRFPSAVIEALVALSILFVAVELVPSRDRPPTLTRRHPWLIAFAFGLLHGMAFAGALAQIGLPPHAAPAALFLFNVGVEIGQLLFIAAALGTIFALRALRRRSGFPADALARLGPAYAIGGFAAYWLIERLATVYA